MSRPQVRRYQQTQRAEKAAATAARILKVARELLLTRWYDDVTLEEIAATSEVAVKTVQRLFLSKENLARTVLLSYGEENERWRSSIAAGDKAAAVAAIVGFYEESGDSILRYLALEPRIAMIAELLPMGRQLHRRWVERVFGPLHSDAARHEQIVTMLVVATDVYTWRLIRRDAGHSVPDCISMMIHSVSHALAWKE